MYIMYKVNFFEVVEGDRIKDHFYNIAKERGILALRSWDKDKNQRFVDEACKAIKELYGFDTIKENGSIKYAVFASEQDYLFHLLKWS